MYAIVTALREELSLYLNRGGFKESALSNGVGVFESSSHPDVMVLEGGVGRDNAEVATRFALRELKPEFIISAGFAGAVTPGLEAGRLFLCDPLAAMDGPPVMWSETGAQPFRSVDEGLVRELTKRVRDAGERFDNCGCMTVSTFISGSGLKSWIGRCFPVQVVDMESYWVCSVASEHSVPSVVVRSVLDGAEQDLPYFVSCEARGGRSNRWARALTVSTFISGSGLKSWIGRCFPVQVVDMESYWVCSVASEHSVPSVVVRSVLDGAEQDLPYFVSCEARGGRSNRWARALRHLALRPLDGPRLLKLRSQSKLANESLSKFLEALHV